MSNIDITKIKLDIAVVGFLFVQLVGIVWWLSGGTYISIGSHRQTS